MTAKQNDKPTFIEEARRKQIIDAALQTIADQGYTQTSFAEIARQLGITKGLIAYHFDGKHDLITSAIHTILDYQGIYIKAAVDAQQTAAGRLQTYITASLVYIQDNRQHFAALVDLWGSFTSPLEKREFSETAYNPCRAHLRKIFHQGQQSGEFGPFDPQVMAAVVQGGIDGLMLQWVFDPQAVDLQAAGQILAGLYLSRVRAGAQGG